MKENDKLLPVLYMLLADELADIKQDMPYSQKCGNRDSGKSGKMISQPVMNIMENVGWLIEQIILLEDSLKFSRLFAMMMRNFDSGTISNDCGDKRGIVSADAGKTAREVDDQNTADMLSRVYKMQKSHVDWFGMALFN